MRIGSLFSGYGGLDMGVRAVLGGTVAWHVEFDRHVSKILAHHYPDIPNYGDITTVNWATVEPVDILTGGFPCQDVSTAGNRAGLAEGTRSGLWSHMAHAVNILRPSLVVIENVRGLLSATASSNMEPCPWCLGDNGHESPLRALGAVLGDLAELGYDARWASVRASDIGACHRRERVFIIAKPADTKCERFDGVGEQHATNAQVRRRADAAGFADAIADADGSGWQQQRGAITTEPKHAAAQHSRHTATDARGQRHGRQQNDRVVGSVGDTSTSSRRAPSTTWQITRDRSDTTTNWGHYRPAIQRWETILGRPAPAPTEPGATGRPQLSPRFVEWMMGLPDGWVTDPAIGITRNNQLKALGNGVVPQQAAAALHLLLNTDPT